jgi:lambda family phage portal protein
LQLVEADRVCNADNVIDSETLSGGIETYPDGALKNVHIRTTHPGGIKSWEMKWEKVPFFGEKTGRRNVLHFYKSIRGDQSRGVPVLATVMEGLKQFAELTQATLDAAVVQTFLSVFIETQDGNGLDLPMGDSTSANNSIKLGSASIIDLMPGEKATVINPTHPNANYATFATEFQKQIGAALNVPMEIITKYFQSSYTAAQGALLEAWRYFYMRRAYAVDNLCQPVYELFIAGEVASGNLIAPGFFTDPEIRAAYCGADCVGPPRGHIREDVQNKADGYAENRGWKTAQQNTQERGNRIDRNTRQRISEIKARKEGGILTKAEDLIDKVEPIEEVIV